MASVDGLWNVTIKSPMGDQKATLSVAASGDTFAGTFTGDEGSLEIADGKVEGDTVSWTMAIVKPLPMTLTSNLTVEGDVATGSVTAGAFGTFPMTGVRA